MPDPQPVTSGATKPATATSFDALDIFGPAPVPGPAASPVLNSGQSLSSLTSLSSTPTTAGQGVAQNGAGAGSQAGKMTKESILALYQKSPVAPSFPTAGTGTSNTASKP
jgi:hypothetical protein